jgi:hypothetical protein
MSDNPAVGAFVDYLLTAWADRGTKPQGDERAATRAHLVEMFELLATGEASVLATIYTEDGSDRLKSDYFGAMGQERIVDMLRMIPTVAANLAAGAQRFAPRELAVHLATLSGAGSMVASQVADEKPRHGKDREDAGLPADNVAQLRKPAQQVGESGTRKNNKGSKRTQATGKKNDGELPN